MANKLNIMEDQLEIGQVKTITSSGGTYVDFVELLFSTTTKVQFAPNEDKKAISLSVSDNQLELPQLECVLDKQTLRNFIISLKNIYNQLEESEE